MPKFLDGSIYTDEEMKRWEEVYSPEKSVELFLRCTSAAADGSPTPLMPPKG